MKAILCNQLSIAIFLLATTTLWSNDFTRFRGADATGVAKDHVDLPESWDKTQNVTWVADIPGQGWGSPIVVGDRVFVSSVVSEEENTKPKGGLYLGQGVREPAKGVHHWMVYCFDLKTGKEMWRRETHKGRPVVPRHPKSSYAAETPTTDGERLFVLFGDLGLYCYSLEGELLWSNPIEPKKTNLDYGAAASPVVHDGQVFVVYDNKEESWIASFDTQTGKQRWITKRDETMSWATPLVWKNKLRTEIVVPGQRVNRSYSLEGKELWSFDGDMSVLVIPSPFASHGMCYISSGYVGDAHRPTFAIQPGAEGKLEIDGGFEKNEFIQWYQPKASPYNTTQIVYGEYLYTVHDQGFLTCHNALTGEEVYGKKRFSPKGSFTASPLAYNGKILCLSEQGLTYVVKAGPEFEVLATNPLDELCIATPSVVDGKLLIRTVSKIYCISAVDATESAQPKEEPKEKQTSIRIPSNNACGDYYVSHLQKQEGEFKRPRFLDIPEDNEKEQSPVVVDRKGDDDPSVTKTKLRDVIVSHTDEKGVLQLFRMKEDGTESRQLTHSRLGCRMPACSPDGEKLVYVQQVDEGLSLWLADIDGKNARALKSEGMNLSPCWMPDSRHVVWMQANPTEKQQDPASNSQLYIADTQTGESRRLFSDPAQARFSNAMPSVSPNGRAIAFVSNRNGAFRIWVSKLEGSDARLVSIPPADEHQELKLPIEQKVPTWSPDGKWIAHWEGVEMIHMSPFTGIKNPERDRLISETFHVWVVGNGGKDRRKVGRGDDPTWSPDGFVTRAFPDAERGGPKIMIETQLGEKELPIVPRHMNWGRFTWIPEKTHPDTAYAPANTKEGEETQNSNALPQVTKKLVSGEYAISQSWSQESDFQRPYYVSVPKQGEQEKLPVFVFLHGNGGNAEGAMRGFMRRRPNIASRYVMVFPQGYRESWNIVSERSKADDQGFIESIVRELATCSNIDSSNFTVMGSSNGAALVNQLAIESKLPNIRNYISGVSPLNVWQHDGKNFKAKGEDNSYRVVAEPAKGKRLLNISGVEDRLVPYRGGPSRVIRAKDGKLGFVDAEKSTFLWAKHFGYEGKQLSEPTKSVGGFQFFSYLDGDVVHCKASGEGHGAAHAIDEKHLLQFLNE